MGKYSWVCHRCGVEAFSYEMNTPPNGWNGTRQLCPYCAAKVADEEMAEVRAYKPSRKQIEKEGKEDEAWFVGYCMGFILACVAYYFLRTWGSAGLAFCIGTIVTLFLFKFILRGLGCSLLVFVIGGLLIIPERRSRQSGEVRATSPA